MLPIGEVGSWSMAEYRYIKYRTDFSVFNCRYFLVFQIPASVSVFKISDICSVFLVYGVPSIPTPMTIDYLRQSTEVLYGPLFLKNYFNVTKSSLWPCCQASDYYFRRWKVVVWLL